MMESEVTNEGHFNFVKGFDWLTVLINYYYSQIIIVFITLYLSYNMSTTMIQPPHSSLLKLDINQEAPFIKVV